jgi:hypothetical protein
MDTSSKDVVAAYEQGVRRFSILFTRWMDTNGWSHPVMTSLAKHALNGVGWLHSSQISGLRHGKLYSPGPRTFLAIHALNAALWEYKENKTLIPGTSSSSNYRDPMVITEAGSLPEAGWWYEVFCGLREPSDMQLEAHFFSEDVAKEHSRVLGRLIRFGLMTNGVDPITELDEFLREHYPTKEVDRVRKMRAIVFNETAWTGEELLNELPALVRVTTAIDGPRTEDELVEYLKTGVK